MAAFSTFIGGALLGGSLLAQNSARRSQKSAAKADLEITQIQNRQARRQFLNQFREAQAGALIGGIASLGGGFESSRISGTASSLSTQKTLALTEFDRQDALGTRAVSKRLDASRYNFMGSVLRTGASFATSGAGSSWLDNLGKGGGATPPEYDFQGRLINYD